MKATDNWFKRSNKPTTLNEAYPIIVTSPDTLLVHIKDLPDFKDYSNEKLAPFYQTKTLTIESASGKPVQLLIKKIYPVVNNQCMIELVWPSATVSTGIFFNPDAKVVI